MKTYTRIMTPIIALAIVAAFCCIPQTAEAGDKEWATAGKILTGLVVLDALTDANHRYYGTRPANVRYDRPPQTYRRDPVIRYVECGTRRIYQPRIRGHVAYVQRWSSCDNNWVTIGTCESIY